MKLLPRPRNQNLARRAADAGAEMMRILDVGTGARPGRHTHSRTPSGRSAAVARQLPILVARSCRMTGSSRGMPVLISSERKVSVSMSARSQRSVSTSSRRIPGQSPNQVVSWIAGLLTSVSIPAHQQARQPLGQRLPLRKGKGSDLANCTKRLR